MNVKKFIGQPKFYPHTMRNFIVIPQSAEALNCNVFTQKLIHDNSTYELEY